MIQAPRVFAAGGWLLACWARLCAGSAGASPERLAPAVVVVTTFDGEYRRWRERLLHEDLPFVAGSSGVPLGWNAELRVLGIVTGMGSTKAAVSISALGHDSRFNLTGSVWLLAGIAGFDPLRAALGSVALPAHLVDGTMAKFVDPREMPGSWATGLLPLNRSRPYGLPVPTEQEEADMVFRVSQRLLDWALPPARAVPLPDVTAAQRRVAAPYADAYPATARAPEVQDGDVLATDLFWSGELSAQWARNWTSYWTSGRASFAASCMEDFAVAQSLAALSRAGLARPATEALLVLRAASNFVMPPPGQAISMDDGFGADFLPEPAFESVYRVGVELVRRIASGQGPLLGPRGAGGRYTTLFA